MEKDIETGQIRIFRTSQWANRAREIKVFIDDVEVGGVHNDALRTFDVSPGKHTVAVKVDWCRTKPFEVEAVKGEITRLEVGSNMRGLKLLLGLFYIFVRPSRYLYVRHLSSDATYNS